MIPKRLLRTVPEHSSDEAERFWQIACDLHLDWEHLTLRDPLDPADFPITAPYWKHTQNGAQYAGLIRLEALLAGGVYIDSDVELYHSLAPLRSLRCFAGWEDSNVVPDAVIGAEPNHPAIRACLALALERLESPSTDWRTGNGAWATGPGVTTTILPGRADVMLLQPVAFYPYHYTQKNRRGLDHRSTPGCYGAHHWAASWLPEEVR